MMKLPTILAAILFLSTLASAQYLDARNNAMGGVGTASSHYLTAGFANPALLTRFRAGDDFGVMLPSIGVVVADQDDLIDNLDELVDGINSLRTKIDNRSVTAADRISLGNRLLALKDSRATVNLDVGFAIAMPSDGFAWAIHGHSYTDLHLVADINPADAELFKNAASGTQLVNDLASEALLLGVVITEVGVSLAKKFDLGGAALSVGLTPKIQRIDTINYSVNAYNFEGGDFDDDKYTNDDTAINADFGAALEFNDAVTIGLMVRNLVRHRYTTVDTSVPPAPKRQFQYTLKPTATLGAAWTNQVLTVAVDTDITKTTRFENRALTSGAVFDDDTQFVRGGLEFDTGWVQLRGGLQTDLEKTVEDLYTGGIGLGLFGVWHLDIGATYSGDSLGGVVQMAFTF